MLTMTSASTNGDGTEVLRVKLMDGRELTLEYSGQMTVRQMAAEVCSAEDRPNSTARLIHAGQVMVPDRTIGSYRITSNIAIHAVLSESESASASNPHPGSSDASGGSSAYQGIRAPRAGAGVLDNAQTYEGVLLMIPPGVILMCLWSLALHWEKGLFHLFSMGSLIALTALYCVCLLPVLSSTFGLPETERAGAGQAQRQSTSGNGNQGGDRAGVVNTLRALASSPEAQSWAIKLSVFVAIFAALVAQV